MHRFTARRVNTKLSLTATSRGVASTVVVPWEKEAVEAGFAAHDDPVWHAVGEAIAEKAQTFDLGAVALDECGHARAQLESVIQGCGCTNYEIFTFGGMSVMDMMEVGVIKKLFCE